MIASPLFPNQANPAQTHMWCENYFIVLENMWEGQSRGRNRVQCWRWLGNQIQGWASKGTGSLCSAYWLAWNVAGLLGIEVNVNWDIREILHCLNCSSFSYQIMDRIWCVRGVQWLTVSICCVPIMPNSFKEVIILVLGSVCWTSTLHWPQSWHDPPVATWFVPVLVSAYFCSYARFWEIAWQCLLQFKMWRDQGGSNSDSHCII